MPTKYNIKRRAALRGMRTRRDFLTDLLRRAASAAQIAAGLLLVLAVLGWMNERDLLDREQTKVEQARAAETKAHKMVAHLLNGRPVIDNTTGDVLFVQVSRQEGL